MTDWNMNNYCLVHFVTARLIVRFSVDLINLSMMAGLVVGYSADLTDLSMMIDLTVGYSN